MLCKYHLQLIIAVVYCHWFAWKLNNLIVRRSSSNWTSTLLKKYFLVFFHFSKYLKPPLPLPNRLEYFATDFLKKKKNYKNLRLQIHKYNSLIYVRIERLYRRVLHWFWNWTKLSGAQRDYCSECPWSLGNFIAAASIERNRVRFAAAVNLYS